MGVKSLWELLEPVGRPTPLETLESKRLAIDSSIWLYQFQATMRDKSSGKALVNAHVLGFLRRITKLLFFGIKPVFVFDGGAPELKRRTIANRKYKKQGARLEAKEVAERLFAAQLRREAVEAAERAQGKGKEGPTVIDENTVYLEDLTGPSVPLPPRTPAKSPNKSVEQPSSSAKKAQWRDHDPYKLPEVDLAARVAARTSTSVPDPRLATEDELRDFIDSLDPDSLDVSSPAFRELPTEVQYEIVGDLRLKSRQTSHKRLQGMLKASRTPLDFSKEQIRGLKQRNELTQQLLVTTDTIGQAHVLIPVRIASERNREYVLVRGEGPEGGWVLGVRDGPGSAADKPIVIDDADVKPSMGGNGTNDMTGIDMCVRLCIGVLCGLTSSGQVPALQWTQIYAPSNRAWLLLVLVNDRRSHRTRELGRHLRLNVGPPVKDHLCQRRLTLPRHLPPSRRCHCSNFQTLTRRTKTCSLRRPRTTMD